MNLLLRRPIEILKTFFVDDYRIANIRYFAEGVVKTVTNGWFEVVKHPEGWTTRFDSTVESLNFGIECYRKRKPDYKLKTAFYIPVKRDYSGNKQCDLYIPIEAFEWELVLDYTLYQYEDRQKMIDLHGIIKRKGDDGPEIGVGFLVSSGREKMISRQETQNQFFDEYITNFRDPLKGIISNYVVASRMYSTRREDLEKQKQQIEEELKNLKPLSWISDLVEPIAKELMKQPGFENRRYDILGPFGIRASTAIHFYKEEAVTHEELFKDCLSITFTPLTIELGEMGIVNYSINTREFRQGTIGEMNDFNHPSIPMKPTIQELAQFILNKK